MNSPVRPDRPWQQRPAPFVDNDFIDMKKIWHAIWSRKLSIILLLLAAVLLTLLLAMRITPTYKAVASVLIEARTAPVVSFQPVVETPEVSEYLQTQLSLIRSRGVAERVVRDLNLTEHPEFDLRQQSGPLVDINALKALLTGNEPEPITEAQIIDYATQRFMDHTSTWVEGKSQLIYISVSMADSFTAAQAANQLAHAYIEAQLEAKVDMSMTAATWMNERLVSLREKLQAWETSCRPIWMPKGWLT